MSAPLSSIAAVLFAYMFACLACGGAGPEEILLKVYKPKSIFRIPETRVEKARYPIIDVHSHDYAPTESNVQRWAQTMDEVGLEKTIILSGATGRRFDQIMAKFGKHPQRFNV